MEHVGSRGERAEGVPGEEEAGDTGGSGRGTAVVRWVAPVNPVTGEADTRLCFLYADMWRRVLDPGDGGMENVVKLPDGPCLDYAEEVAPDVYDFVLTSVLSVVKRLDLRYEKSDEGGRRVEPVLGIASPAHLWIYTYM